MIPFGRRIFFFLLHMLAAGAGLLTCTIPGRAQDLSVRLTIVSLAAPPLVRVEGNYLSGSSAWSFRNASGPVVGLGERIQDLMLRDSSGASIQVRKTSAGEFRSESSATHFSYQVRLVDPPEPVDAAHISGLNQDYGYLMLGDLLPILACSETHVEFQLPDRWSVASSAAKQARGWYQVSDPASAVFFVGRDLRVVPKKIGATEFSFVSSGEWPFPGAAVTKVAGRIITDYRKLTGLDLKREVVLMLAPLPGLVGAERWSSETRGSSVVLLLGRTASRTALLGQLSVVLTHELFHLWVPNALSLDGDYDWFFEGFTLYEALRAAVRLGFIDFREYLNTLARVYDSYLASAERDRYSLLESSARRWTAAPSLVYDKGMLVAFLYDLRLRQASHSRRSLDDVYQELFRLFPPGTGRTEGNTSIISVLIREDGDALFARRYIQNAGSIDLENSVQPYGMMLTNSIGRHQLTIADAISKEQRDLLSSLGYRGPRR